MKYYKMKVSKGISIHIFVIRVNLQYTCLDISSTQHFQNISFIGFAVFWRLAG